MQSEVVYQRNGSVYLLLPGHCHDKVIEKSINPKLSVSQHEGGESEVPNLLWPPQHVCVD